ncbi:DUF2637 domain-containing protein [Actinoplanes sp. TRM 88003]|uniref:DUF2637 domain-containing protein n=1 Tax=Paractinoplanes aksuensis TaxID=2939490 RepID=A0ABT1DVA4_9ACTN|nr:DUF2637 domain-containing protein [Actinoplanes aksuensis]MCO8274784.1 DUF2637 domain-containing protein [Actinoplanes aksuensis]
MSALPQLKRIRWAVRGALALGVVVSTIANVLHAVDNPISQTIAAWPPIALLLTVELISRIPVHSRWLAVVRVTATAGIAGIAAWVSYWHMVGVAAHYGETGASPYLLPLSVDGLIVVASICLVELGDRIRAADPAPAIQLAASPVTPPAAAAPVTEAPAEPAAAPAKRPAPKRVAPRPTSADKVAKVAARMPAATAAEVAAKAGVSERTARRYLPARAAIAPPASDPQAAETPALVAA